MARGQKRSKTEILTERLQQKNAEIAKYTEALNKAKEEKKQIEEELKRTRLESLVDELDRRGLTVEQALEMLEKTNEQPIEV